MSRFQQFIRAFRDGLRRSSSSVLERSNSFEDAEVGGRVAERDIEHFRLVAENARDIIWLLDYPSTSRYVSPACKEILGWSPEEQLEREGGLQMLTEESAERSGRLLESAIRQRLPSITYEAEHRCADGSTVWCEVHQGITYDEAGNPVSSVGVTRDISEKRELQEQLALAQRTEALGTLAGGVAHDFNNFLTVIIVALELISNDQDKDDSTTALIAEALAAAERSAALTSQLLAFSRHQPTATEPFDVNALILRMAALMKRVSGERIRINNALASDLPLALGDEHQLQQVLLNLIINARDAIEGDGLIRIETAETRFDRPVDREQSTPVPGRYVAITVSDNGSGMEEAVRDRATEPFFSTKEKGSGTGLGLAMVKSILDRFGGGVSIESEIDTGTRVTVYLPIATHIEQSASPRVKDLEPASRSRDAEKVLVVEDEPSVRAVTVQTLKQAGYEVCEAPDPGEALRILASQEFEAHPPDLILTDLVMPGMSGTELAERIRQTHPDARFVVMSGYTEEETRDPTGGSLPGPLVAKPFHPNTLLRAARSVLD